MRVTRAILWLAALAWMVAPGCTTLESDYAKNVTSDRPTFPPRQAGTVEVTELKRVGEQTLAEFGEETGKAASLEFHYEPGSLGAGKHWEGFDVTVTLLDEHNRPVKKAGGMVMELYRFNPDVRDTLGQRLLVWEVPEEQLIPTWEDQGYHFHLSWWKTKPREENFYVVMVVHFVTHDGQVFTLTKAPVSINQSRYDK